MDLRKAVLIASLIAEGLCIIGVSLDIRETIKRSRVIKKLDKLEETLINVANTFKKEDKPAEESTDIDPDKVIDIA